MFDICIYIYFLFDLIFIKSHIYNLNPRSLSRRANLLTTVLSSVKGIWTPSFFIFLFFFLTSAVGF